MLLFLHHPRFCRLMKTPNHTVDIAVSMGWRGKKSQESRVFYFPDKSQIAAMLSDHFQHEETKKKLLGMSGIDRRSLIFAWSRPWPDFPDTYLSTISDDRGNGEIPDLPDI